MPAWRRFARPVLAAAMLAVLAAGVARSAPPPAEQRSETTISSVEKIRSAAAEAERQQDWETAFSLHCRLLLTDRTPAAREKVSSLLRRAQQVRRHRDPAFRQFVEKLSVSDALTLYAEIVTKLPTLFADRDRAAPKLLWEYGIEEMDRALASPTFRQAYLSETASERIAAFSTSLREKWAKQPVANAREARSQLRGVIGAATEVFPARIAAAVAIEFVCGSCAGLDDYTVFLTPSQAVAEGSLALADLEPFGIYVAFDDAGLKVQGVVPNSWAAQHTTLTAGDRIVRINGRLFTPGNPDLLAESLRNPTGNLHRLDIAGLLVSVDIPVSIPTVYGSALLSAKDGVGYLRLGSFRDTTLRELEDAVEFLRGQGMRSLVLDLRGNHGGLFAAGLQVAQRFLPAGIIVTAQGQTTEYANRIFSSDSGMAAWDIPLVLLVDGETASAAEVLAGAIKDHQRGTLVGMPTFGKGSLQFPVKLTSLDESIDGTRPRSGAVRVTIARLLSPRGTPLTGQGIAPNIMEADPIRQIELAVVRAIELLPAAPMP